MSRVNVGDKYCKLTVVSLIKDKKNPKAKCLCECGNFCFPQRGALKNGRATSCGCKKADEFIKRATTHGKSKSKEYKTWRGMVSRCTNPKLPEYKNYGGRGIQIKWKSFDDFYKDMGDKPPKSWIDRIDNNGHYEQENCKWVTPKQNSANKRTSKLWFIDGNVFETSNAAAKFLQVNASVIVRGCNGYERRGKIYPPKTNWRSEFKYKSEEIL
jgi:hypothetical protein